jgi:hypothetical protein
MGAPAHNLAERRTLAPHVPWEIADAAGWFVEIGVL